jgi:hypothetical protein
MRASIAVMDEHSFTPRTEPADDWLPLAAAALSIQAEPPDSDALVPELFSRESIESFIRDRVVGGRIGGCEVDFEQGRVDLFYRPIGEEQENSYQVETLQLDAIAGWLPDDGSPADLDNFLTHAGEIWPRLQRRFRTALWLRRWTIVGRIASPFTAGFTEIDLRDFLALRVLDWERGIAANEFGERVCSIHVLETRSTLIDIKNEWKRQPKSAAVAQFIYRFLDGQTAHLSQAEIDALRVAISGVQITQICRAAITRHCSANQAYTIPYRTVEAGIALANRLRALSPTALTLKKLGIAEIQNGSIKRL